MSPHLTLLRLAPDMAALAAWGAARGFLPRGVDAGYALHAASRAALGDLAPRPFVLREPPGQAAELLGYIRRPAAEILDAARLPPVHDGQAAAALRLASLEAREMPLEWTAGRRLSFTLRARPVARPRTGRHGAEGEVDVAFWARRQDPGTSAEAAYLAWLTARMQPAVRLLEAAVLGHRSVDVLRRPRVDGGRRPQCVPGPDVTFRGVLEVADPEGFTDLLALGVGRHRAFGFGCLLIAPPGAL